MREINTHKVNGLNETIVIGIMDEPGDGGANHQYRIYLLPENTGLIKITDINFQKGPIQEEGYNGISNEALLAILIDRMQGFQSGPFACRENAIALTKMEETMMWLQKRTRDRMARGVEGTHNK